ncbi:MAG: flippase-like domain-containing protein [Methylobacteriaceae bacterium]|jgi:uncharacterized protein (TIRG00374 family)|nr:flippase-like domain-containing protein [Methylobacteriaceae bacterium]
MKRSAVSLLVISVLYLGLLLWGDFRRQAFAELPKLVVILPVMAGYCVVSLVFRFARWRWLMFRAGAQLPPLAIDFLCYLTGLAFTATPGKVGELVRIRYYETERIPASLVISAFVFDRTTDLIAVLVLASLVVSNPTYLLIAYAFVGIFIGLIAVFVLKADTLEKISAALSARNYRVAPSVLTAVQKGLSTCKVWLNPLDIGLSMVLALLAWSAVSFGFVHFMWYVGMDIPALTGLTIYPLATLVGAASMLPGGLVSTEAAFTALMVYYGAGAAMAAVVTIGTRFATIWFSIIIGFLAMAYLEYRRNRLTVPADAA